MKFSQSLILSIPIARPGDKVPAANARVDVYCEHADRDGAIGAHRRLAEALRPVLARWLVDESKVVELRTLDDCTGNRGTNGTWSAQVTGVMRVGAPPFTGSYSGTMPGESSWESETLRMADEQRMADESGIDGDDDEVGD